MMLSLPQYAQPIVLANDPTLLLSAKNSSEKLFEFRKNAALRLADGQMPTRKTEHWKYNDLSNLLGLNFPANDPAQDESDVCDKILRLKDAYHITILDGQYSQQDSIERPVKGLKITAYCDASEQQLKLIASNLIASKQDKNILIELNHAITNNGLLVEIDSNIEIDKPLCISHICTQADKNKLDSSQIVFHIGANSRVQIVEQFVSRDVLQENQTKFQNLTLQQTIIDQQPSSYCDYSRLNLESANHCQVSRLLARLTEKASFNSFFYCEGSALNKTDIDVQHIGEHSESKLTGIYLPVEQKVTDYHTNIQMEVPNCTSNEVFRGIIADSSKSTFNGKIHIFKDAQKSDAKLSNKNLLLTNQAEINTKPELEIYANDVICAHGATIAKIDEQAIYYLQTRGIDNLRARKMLSVGFINELVAEIDNQDLQQLLSQRIQNNLSGLK